jgi:Tol biopolymer transport system component
MTRQIGDNRNNILERTTGEDIIEGWGSGDRRLGAVSGTTTHGNARGGDDRLVRSRAARMFLAAELALVLGAPAPAGAQGITERVSVGPGGVQANNTSYGSALSADGRFVAFDSSASNLVPGDSNGVLDVFVRDRQTGITQRVSVGLGGAQGNSYSGDPALSADGRFVAFESGATNLVPGDTNGVQDVFVRDLQTGTTERVSVGPGGGPDNESSGDPALSADGRFVAFYSGDSGVFVLDRQTGTTERVSVGPGGVPGNESSAQPALSADGRFVAFTSGSSNLVPGDTNNLLDIFVRDRQTGTTERVSVGPGGPEAYGGSWLPAISADGRFVAFMSMRSFSRPSEGDVFLHDRQTGTIQRVSVGPGSVQTNNWSSYANLSADGRFVAFGSWASNLVPGDTNGVKDVFVRDLQTGTIQRVSVGPGGVQGNAAGVPGANGSGRIMPALSADGRFVAFDSHSSNLVPGDTNGKLDTFVRTR